MYKLQLLISYSVKGDFWVVSPATHCCHDNPCDLFQAFILEISTLCIFTCYCSRHKILQILNFSKNMCTSCCEVTLSKSITRKINTKGSPVHFVHWITCVGTWQLLDLPKAIYWLECSAVSKLLFMSSIRTNILHTALVLCISAHQSYS